MLSAKFKVLREVSDQQLLGEPLRRFFKAAQYTVVKAISQPGIVPIDEGYLRGAWQEGAGGWDIDHRAIPQWALVGVRKGRKAKGATPIHDYGLYLEKGGRYHYARGPSQGQLTQGWVERGRDIAAKDVRGPLLQQLAADIEAAWNG